MKHSLKKNALVVLIGAAALTGAGQASAEIQGYAGLNLGWNATELEQTVAADEGGIAVTEEASEAAHGVAFGSVAGLKLPISTGYLALEVNLEDSSAEAEQEAMVNGAVTMKSSTTSNLSYGVTGILATSINESTFLYGLAGYQMTDMELKYSDRNPVSGTVASDNSSETFGGFRVGAGVETKLTHALSLRMEWSQTHYSSEEFAVNSALYDNGAQTIELEPVENRISIGVIGHF